jgi:hypothetical protein
MGSVQAMNALVNLYPFADSSATDAVLGGELSVPTTLLKILLNDLFF